MKVDQLKNDMLASLSVMDSSVFDIDVFKKTGLFIVRDAIPDNKLHRWQNAWEEYANSEEGERKEAEDNYSKVEIKTNLPDLLDGIHRDECFVDLAEEIFGNPVGLFNKRFVVKDAFYNGEVFLHQDTCYQCGLVEKASLFGAIFDMTPDNGGLKFYPGTHRFGYLGDAGQIKETTLPDDWPIVAPSLRAGDIAIMNSLLWHGSPAYKAGHYRVVADFVYQSARDYSTVEVLRGNEDIENNFLNQGDKGAGIFQRSRVSRLIELQKIVDDALRNEQEDAE
ncbi:hypothetical protein A9Q99_08360 [Gammaproteobacteria bacterium 45_16_T64]|nr:hypothetical protein A9Q99_08360 [Gammaproteobacteria bacterium 45_16_T64]